MSLIITNCAEEFKRGLQIVSDLTDRCKVSASVAVIRCAPDGDDVLVREVVFVPLVYELVCSRNEGKVVDVAEFVCDFVAEEPTCGKKNVR